MPTAKRRTQKATRPPATPPVARTHQLRERVICPRHRWPEAHTILRRERQPAELSSPPTGDVLIVTTPHAADQLRRICTPAPSRTPDWKPHDEPTARRERDPLDERWERAFSRYRAERTTRESGHDQVQLLAGMRDERP